MDIRDLGPHDPLPDAPSVTVLRRFAEEDPSRTVIELIVQVPHGRADDPGTEARALTDWDAATLAASEIAARTDLDCVWRIDRTAGAMEREVLQRHGDHSAPGITLSDDDIEEGEHGADMRDVGRATTSRAL